METSQRARLPLLELSLDPFMEGGSKGATPKGKTPSSTLKRARSPAPSSSTSLTGPDGWLSPSKRRVLFAEGFLSPNHARTTPARRLFGRVDDDHEDNSPAHDSPVGRALFSAREIEPGVMSAFAAAHSHSGSRGVDPAGSGSTPSRVAISASAKKASLAMIASTRDDVTVVDSASVSSPATLASSQSASSTPRVTRSHTRRRSANLPTYRGLEPSPEINPSSPSLGPVSSVHPTISTPKAATLLAPPLPITNAKSTKASKADIPATYSSNPIIPLDAPELHFTRPSLQESMTFVAGSRHYPGFTILPDSPPPSASSSSSSSPLALQQDATVSSSTAAHDVSDNEQSSFEDDEDDDKENAAALHSAVQRIKRKKLGTPSRTGTPIRELAAIVESPATPRPACETPERVSKRARVAGSPALLLASPILPPSASKVQKTRATASAGLTMEAGRDAMTRRAERRRLLEMEVDDN